MIEGLPTERDLLVSLIIPAYNEESRLRGSVELYHAAFTRAFGSAFELLVVCNGCTDATPDLARRLAESTPGLRVLVIAGAVGKGGAVVAGFREARGESVVFADADAATDPHSLLELVDKLRSYDVAIGSRRVAGSVITQPQPLLRRLFGGTFYQLTRVIFGLTFLDTQCGAKALRRSSASRLAEEISEFRWTFDVDLLLAARRLDLTVIESPVVWTDVPGSKLRVLPTISQVARSFWRLKRKELAARPVAPLQPATPAALPAVPVPAPERDLERIGAN